MSVRQNPNKKMVVGFNHNIKHKGKVYHVQTEDSGVDNPHIITHLFVGGNILASKRSSYRDIVDVPDLHDRVRTLMEAQHKEMLKGLVAGAFERQEAQVASKSFQPGELATSKPPPAAPSPASTLTEAGVSSIFAEDLISERSLDEVILSYLAGDPKEE